MNKLVVVLGILLFLSPVDAGDIVIHQYHRMFMHSGAPIDEITISVGDVVVFENNDTFYHNVFSLSNAQHFDIGNQAPGENNPVVFLVPGEVEIECAIHPEMFMKVIIK